MYIYVWEYDISEENREAFEHTYGKKGDWVNLFTGKDGYVGTEFYKDPEKEGRYITIDKWESKEKLLAFKEKYKNEFEDIDQKCMALTRSEIEIGKFETF